MPGLVPFDTPAGPGKGWECVRVKREVVFFFSWPPRDCLSDFSEHDATLLDSQREFDPETPHTWRTYSTRFSWEA